jgi:hypothetical protein
MNFISRKFESKTSTLMIDIDFSPLTDPVKVNEVIRVLYRRFTTGLNLMTIQSLQLPFGKLLVSLSNNHRQSYEPFSKPPVIPPNHVERPPNMATWRVYSDIQLIVASVDVIGSIHFEDGRVGKLNSVFKSDLNNC